MCCQNISHIPELKDFNLGNGICKYFDFQTKGCKIYEQRPLICKVDESFEKIYFKQFSQKEFYQLNAQVCNNMQEKLNLNLSFRVKISN